MTRAPVRAFARARSRGGLRCRRAAALGLSSLLLVAALASAQTPVQTPTQGPAQGAPGPQAVPVYPGLNDGRTPGLPDAAANGLPAGAAPHPSARPAQRPLRPERKPAEPSEFERYVSRLNHGQPVRRFGAPAVREDGTADHLQTPARVPPQYLLRAGDELHVTLWGSVDADWRARIDRAGRVTLPRVGPVPVAGAPAAELEKLLRPRLERVFRNFELSAGVAEVSPVRVHVTGFVEQPGSYVVPGLTTLSDLVATVQGPSAAGSYRRIRLLRRGEAPVTLDLYQLLAEGRQQADPLLQADDVVHVDAGGPQVAVLGSVKRPAVFEVLPGETLADVLRLAGGFSAVADRSRVAVESLSERGRAGVVELALPSQATRALADGDVLRVFSAVDAEHPTQLRNKRVRVEGEVRQPGDYVLPAHATLADALAAAGGVTEAAYLFGTEFKRESVRRDQEVSYERALQELEAELARQPAPTSAEDAGATEEAARRVVERLRARRPQGRVVLEIAPDATALPPLALEDGDSLRVPPRYAAVGVFGSVYSSGSFVHEPGHSVGPSLGYYLDRAGGATAAADAGGTFVVRANGSVISARQGGWLRGFSLFRDEPALPGDTVFVPEELRRLTLVQGAKDWTQILYQFGLGVAGLLLLR